MIKLKVGRNILDIDDNDLILDNGACYQIVTKRVGFGPKEFIPVMSKKLFHDLKQCSLIFTSEALKQAAKEKYENPQVEFWKFNVNAIKKLGY